MWFYFQSREMSFLLSIFFYLLHCYFLKTNPSHFPLMKIEQIFTLKKKKKKKKKFFVSFINIVRKYFSSAQITWHWECYIHQHPFNHPSLFFSFSLFFFFFFFKSFLSFSIPSSSYYGGPLRKLPTYLPQNAPSLEKIDRRTYKNKI